MEFKLDFALGIQIPSPLISDLTHFHSQSLPTSQNIYPNLSQGNSAHIQIYYTKIHYQWLANQLL